MNRFLIALALTLSVVASSAAPQAAWQTITVNTNGGGGGTGNLVTSGTATAGMIASYLDDTHVNPTNTIPLLMVDQLTSSAWLPSTVMVTDASTNLVSSVVTAAELSILSGNTNDPTKIAYQTGWGDVPAGGDLLWYSYATIDEEGGPISVTASTNAVQLDIIRFAGNYLSNYWGAPGQVVFIGGNGFLGSQPDPGVIASNNVGIFGFGDSVFANSTFIGNNFDITGIGDNTFAEAVFMGPIGTYSSGNIVGVGDYSGNKTVFTNSGALFLASYGGAEAIFADSGHGFLVNDGGYRSKFTNAFNVNVIGGLFNATLVDTTHFTAIGRGAGDGITGAYTNVVLIGDGATLGATGKDEVVLAPSMSLSVGTTISAGATNQWKLGGVIAPGGTTNLVVTVDGQKYQVLAVPIP